jgi:hypothetical protein
MCGLLCVSCGAMYALHDGQQSEGLSGCGPCCKKSKKSLIFQRRRLNAAPAPEPSDILWSGIPTLIFHFNEQKNPVIGA